MTIADLAILGAFLLTNVSLLLAKVTAIREFDNRNPRDPGFYRPAFRARALWAHQNGHEAFPLFIAAVLLAEMRGVQQGPVDTAALGFLVARGAYVACYLGDKPTLRSIFWFVALGLNLWIFGQVAVAVP